MDHNDSLMLKSQVQGLLDALTKESARDKIVSDAVMQIVSSRRFSDLASFVRHMKGALADFILAELTGVECEPKQKALDRVVGQGEAYLHVLAHINGSIPALNEESKFAPWHPWTKRVARLVENKMLWETDDIWDIKSKVNMGTLLGLFLEPLVVLNSTLSQDIWENRDAAVYMAKKEKEEAAAAEQVKRKAEEVQHKAEPVKKKKRVNPPLQ